MLLPFSKKRVTVRHQGVTVYKKQTDSYLEVKECQAKLNNFFIAKNIIILLIVSLIAFNIIFPPTSF